MRIAVFGGSFNPVHNGHIELAKAVHEQAGYDKVLFVPAYHSPFKDLPSGASDEDRLCMLHLALDGFDWACIEDCELKRGGVSYTYETIEFLERKYTASGDSDEKLTGKLGLVIGADLVSGFSKWYRADELASKVDIVLARRKLDSDASGRTPHNTEATTADESASQKLPVLPFAHYELENPYVDVSSSEIRDAVHAAAGNAMGRATNAQNATKTASRKKLQALVPESVCDYILERRLYE